MAEVAALHKLGASVVGPGAIYEAAPEPPSGAAADSANSRGWVSYFAEVGEGPGAGAGTAAGAAGAAGAAEAGVGATDAVACLVGCLRSDRPDNLFPTVVCDRQGIAMGLVYSTAESLRAR